MTLEEAIYDTRILIRQTTDDSRFSDMFILKKLLNYRSLFIVKEYLQTKEINPAWIQRVSNKKLTPVNSADNPAIPAGSIRMGKTNIPYTIPIGKSFGVQMVLNTQRQKEIYRESWMQLMNMIQNKDFRVDMFRYYVQHGQEAYIYPYCEAVDMLLILDNVLDGYEFATEYVDFEDLEDGVEYFVMSGSVSFVLGATTTVYRKYDSFTADTSGIYSGDAKLRKSTTINESITGQDYHIDSGMGQLIILEMISKDFGLEKTFVADRTNDSSDEAKNYPI